METLVWELPFHLCSYTAMLLPFAVAFKSKKLCATLSLWSIGALVAIVLNDEAVGYKINSIDFAIYYFPHLIEFTVPLLMLFLGKFKIKFKDIYWILGLTFGVYTLSFIVNLILTKTIAPTNYLFSMGPTNPVTQALYNILPCKYFYMYLTLPAIVALSLGIYAIAKEDRV